ncbi:MAG: AbrB/MazE/SpoVT family DNA-binding domain-containing protein [Candidatus Nanohalobium sp.]
MAGFIRFSGQVDSKGRVTIPSRIRDKLGLESGDRVSLQVKSCEVIWKKFDSQNQALSYLSGLENVKRFSFDGKVLEVVLGE